MSSSGTSDHGYAKRLQRLQKRRWKVLLDVQRPYRWNLKRLRPGRSLDIGCGIGRCLENLPKGSVGIDHNELAIKTVNDMGLIGFLPEDFKVSSHCRPESFDTLLLSHVLEHLSLQDSSSLLGEYLPLLKDDGSVIVFCPQERGYASDQTHVTFLDFSAIEGLLMASGLVPERRFSFPFPRIIGKVFKYNEFVVVGRKPG